MKYFVDGCVHNEKNTSMDKELMICQMPPVRRRPNNPRAVGVQFAGDATDCGGQVGKSRPDPEILCRPIWWHIKKGPNLKHSKPTSMHEKMSAKQERYAKILYYVQIYNVCLLFWYIENKNIKSLKHKFNLMQGECKSMRAINSGTRNQTPANWVEAIAHTIPGHGVLFNLVSAHRTVISIQIQPLSEQRIKEKEKDFIWYRKSYGTLSELAGSALRYNATTRTNGIGIDKAIPLTLIRLEQEVEKKRPELIDKKGVVFNDDNAMFSHSANIERVWLRSYNAVIV
ncbi:hypothetical protein EVAR_2622_1 [Eumeta japonica]|uniref:Uncharacterized protein n=1 Tax=Eumeta variegata TaxID=151549 RepID=A0A4C1SPQ6_EUMVA|nr:hypothetical protein EVAR_2622_1 [Eumeta japonica]